MILVALKRAGWVDIRMKQYSLLGAGVLGDSLGSFRHGVLGQLARQEQSDSSLDLARSDCRPTGRTYIYRQHLVDIHRLL